MNYRQRIVLVGVIGGTLGFMLSYYGGKHTADRWYAAHPVKVFVSEPVAAPMPASPTFADPIEIEVPRIEKQLVCPHGYELRYLAEQLASTGVGWTVRYGSRSVCVKLEKDKKP